MSRTLYLVLSATVFSCGQPFSSSPVTATLDASDTVQDARVDPTPESSDTGIAIVDTDVFDHAVEASADITSLEPDAGSPHTDASIDADASARDANADAHCITYFHACPAGCVPDTEVCP